MADGKREMADDLNCQKCNRPAYKREKKNGMYFWHHNLSNEGIIPRGTMCTMKSEDYE